MALLSTPITAGQLAKSMGFTRQRASQILLRLHASGAVRRIPYPPHRNRQDGQLWLKKDLPAPSDLPLSATEQRHNQLISALIDGWPRWLTVVAAHLGMNAERCRTSAEELASLGLVTLEKAGTADFVQLVTREGRRPEPEAGLPAPAKPSDIFSDRTIAFVEALAVLGSAKTNELSDACGPIFAGCVFGPGQLIGSLLTRGYAEQVGSLGSRRTYRLTLKGLQLARFIAIYRSPRPKEDYLQQIKAAREARFAKKNGANAPFPSAAEAA